MSRRRLTILMFTCLVVGLVLMLGFELPLLGVPLLFAFIVAGVFLIADPAELSPDPPILAAPRHRGPSPESIGREPGGSPHGHAADRL